MAHRNHAVFDEKSSLILGVLTKGTNLMTGIIHECEKYHIDSGVVTCIGSLERATFVQPDGSNEKPAYTSQKVVEGPIEILSGTEFLSRDENGQLDLHFHGLIVNKQGQLFGGHFLKEGNPILVTLEFLVQIGESITATRHYDESLGFKVNRFQKKSIYMKEKSRNFKE